MRAFFVKAMASFVMCGSGYEAPTREQALRHDALARRWLVQRIGRKPELHGNERALLEFIRQVSPSIHPDLLPLIDRVA